MDTVHSNDICRLSSMRRIIGNTNFWPWRRNSKRKHLTWSEPMKRTFNAPICLMTILLPLTTFAPAHAGNGLLDKLDKVIKALPQQPAAGVANEAGARADAAGMPSASRATPDVLGIKLGVTEPPAARSIMTTGQSLPLSLQESRSHLMTRSETGSVMDVPDTDYVMAIDGKRGNGNCQGGMSITTCSRRLIVYFLPPPGPPMAFYVTVNSAYHPQEATSLPNMRAALEKKYGGPGFLVASSSGTAEQLLIWAWRSDGSLVPLTDTHICAQPGQASIATGDPIGRSVADGKAVNQLQAGCVAVIHVRLGIANNTVNSIQTQAFDTFHFHESLIRTEQYVTEYQKTHDQSLREQADKRSAPAL
jgi:hypothetical protein